MPKPRPYERQADFVERCIPELLAEGKPRDQAVAQCYAIWNQK